MGNVSEQLCQRYLCTGSGILLSPTPLILSQQVLCENTAHEPANPAFSLLKLSEIWAMHGRGACWDHYTIRNLTLVAL